MEYIIYLILAVLILIPVYLFYLSRNVKRAKEKLEWHKSQTYTTLRIDVPKNNEKTPLSAEQMFASIHGIYAESSKYQNHLSFEIVARDKYIQFYVHLPRHIKDFVEGQIYAQYPSVEINEVKDYTENIRPTDISFASCELSLTKPDVYPIKVFTSFEVDPLSGITSVMSKLEGNEEVWFQILVRPVGDDWQEKGNRIVSAVRSGRKPGGQGLFEALFGGMKNFLSTLFREALQPGSGVGSGSEKTEVKLPASVEEALHGIEQKIVKLGFETKIRIFAIANDSLSAKVKCQGIAATFKQFNTTNLNGFKAGEITQDKIDAWQDFVERSFEDEGEILNITELASVYHLPHVSVETPNIVWSGAKKGEPPANLPLMENTPAEDLTILGVTNFRNVYREFGIKLDDRRRHIYIVGKSGTGKSTLIENMAINDVYAGKGVVVVDPHGDLADKVLACVPENREEDVIVFDPADRAYPIAFNLLETVEDDFKGMVASGFVGIFKKIFGDSWGPRLEHILRNTVLALLDYPDSTMLDIPNMLTNNRFREKVVEKVKDSVIREFWVNEFAQYDNKFRTEAVSPILNKVGQFLSTATIRNIVGQPKSRINIREIMDNKKILVINLSRGKIGEDNSALLGAMMITKIQLAAMSRADVSADQRPDCYLYVDEFQNFATDSFAVILSEARKYNLCLTMANQYIDQMPEQVRSAVFGNAGTIITFRVGGNDASFLVKEFEPVFDANDLVNLDRHTVYMKLLIDGIAPPAFSAKTLPPVQKTTGNSEKILNLSRQKYASLRNYVEEQIDNRTKQEENELKAEAEMFRQGGLEALLTKKSVSPSASIEAREVVGTSNLSNASNASNASNSGTTTTNESNSVGVDLLKQNSTENQSAIADSKNEQASVVANEELAERPEKATKPRILKHQNVVGNKIYKEQTARGGAKWYIGEEIDLEKIKEMGIEVNDESLSFMKLAKAAEDHANKGKNQSRSQSQSQSQGQGQGPKENKKPERGERQNEVAEKKTTIPDRKSEKKVENKESGAKLGEHHKPFKLPDNLEEEPVKNNTALSGEKNSGPVLKEEGVVNKVGEPPKDSKETIESDEKPKNTEDEKEVVSVVAVNKAKSESKAGLESLKSQNIIVGEVSKSGAITILPNQPTKIGDGGGGQNRGAVDGKTAAKSLQEGEEVQLD